MNPQTLRLVPGRAADAPARTRQLEALGYSVRADSPPPPVLLKELREAPPDGVVIDLEGRPAYGRELALAIRRTKTGRRLPLTFLGGAPEAVACVQALLPDAVYAAWTDAEEAIRGALAHPPANPVAPPGVMAAYVAVPLARKLGFKAGQTVALIDAPPGFEGLLDGLPPDVTIRRGARPRDVALWFVRRREALDRRIDAVTALARDGDAWIAWPKHAADVPGDLSQVVVRAAGLAHGLVDYKICAIDPTWSGLRFTRRKIQPARRQNPAP